MGTAVVMTRSDGVEMRRMRADLDVRTFRRELGMTQMEFATAIGGVSTSTVSHWENGHNKPSKLAAERIRRLVGKRRIRADAVDGETESEA